MKSPPSTHNTRILFDSNPIQLERQQDPRSIPAPDDLRAGTFADPFHSHLLHPLDLLQRSLERLVDLVCVPPDGLDFAPPEAPESGRWKSAPAHDLHDPMPHQRDIALSHVAKADLFSKYGPAPPPLVPSTHVSDVDCVRNICVQCEMERVGVEHHCALSVQLAAGAEQRRAAELPNVLTVLIHICERQCQFQDHGADLWRDEEEAGGLLAGLDGHAYGVLFGFSGSLDEWAWRGRRMGTGEAVSRGLKARLGWLRHGDGGLKLESLRTDEKYQQLCPICLLFCDGVHNPGDSPGDQDLPIRGSFRRVIAL